MAEFPRKAKVTNPRLNAAFAEGAGTDPPPKRLYTLEGVNDGVLVMRGRYETLDQLSDAIAQAFEDYPNAGLVIKMIEDGDEQPVLGAEPPQDELPPGKR